jgi:hypothetical protein
VWCDHHMRDISGRRPYSAGMVCIIIQHQQKNTFQKFQQNGEIYLYQSASHQYPEWWALHKALQKIARKPIKEIVIVIEAIYKKRSEFGDSTQYWRDWGSTDVAKTQGEAEAAVRVSLTLLYQSEIDADISISACCRPV